MVSSSSYKCPTPRSDMSLPARPCIVSSVPPSMHSSDEICRTFFSHHFFSTRFPKNHLLSTCSFFFLAFPPLEVLIGDLP
ncbi:hypothetical protein LguiB_031398 [Lonicera macranthoides]